MGRILTTVWISRYVGPVFSAERELLPRSDGKFYVSYKYVCLVVGRDCFLTEEAATTNKKVRLTRQLKNLKKQTAKLTAQLKGLP